MSVQQDKKTESGSSGVATASPREEQKTRQSTQAAKSKPRQLPPYHVVLLNDDDHSCEYVIEMMRTLFGYPPERGFRIAEEVNANRKAVVFTTHKELAELKRDQIHSFGTDTRVPTCAGSMSAMIVPAEGC